MAGELEPSVEHGLVPQRGLLFTGEAVDRLRPDQLAAIGEFASRMYGVEMRQVHRVEQLLGGVALDDGETAKSEPIPATHIDFRDFADARGLSASMAGRVWRWVERTARGNLDEFDDPTYCIVDELPRVEMLGTQVDVQTLYAHVLEAMRRVELVTGSEMRDAFLIAFLNETLQPSTRLPLPLSAKRGRRLRGQSPEGNG